MSLETNSESVRGAVGSPGRLFHEFLVELGVFLFLLRAELFVGQLVDLFVQLLLVDLREVLVVGRQDAGAVEQGSKKSFGCG